MLQLYIVWNKIGLDHNATCGVKKQSMNDISTSLSTKDTLSWSHRLAGMTDISFYPDTSES